MCLVEKRSELEGDIELGVFQCVEVFSECRSHLYSELVERGRKIYAHERSKS